MKDDILTFFQGLPIGTGSDLKGALTQALYRYSDKGPLSVRHFRDHFSAINRSVRDGAIQLVGTDDSQNVLVSVDSLAALIKLASGKISLADALHASGFEAVDADLTADQDYSPDEGLRFGTLDEDGVADAAS